MASGRTEAATVVLFSIIFLGTTPSLSSLVYKSVLYTSVPIDTARSLGTLLLEDIHRNTSRIACSWRCAHHENCTVFLHDQNTGACALHGLDYPRAGFPRDAPPTDPWLPYVMQTGCQYNYTRRINKCFLIRDATTLYPQAVSYCSSLGGRLMQYTSMDDLLFFQQLMLNRNGDASMAYYLGAQLVHRGNGTFLWTNTSRTMVPGDPMWQSTQPDGYQFDGEDCVEINDYARYMLNDVSCFADRSAICEFNVWGR